MRGMDCTPYDTAFRRKLRDKSCWFFIICLSFAICLFASAAPAQDDMLRQIEAKQAELREREETLKHDERSLNILKKQVDDKIESYSKLLVKVEAAVKILEQAKGDKIDNVVKAYEVMAPEDAASRLSALDDKTVLRIMTKMKSKKAGAIIGLMEPKKAAALTKSMTALPIKPQE